jgi:hypothetical protein
MSHAATPEDSYVLLIGLGLPTTNEIDLRVPPAVKSEFLAVLDEESIHYGEILEFSAGSGDWPAYAVFLTASSLTVRRLSGALVAFLQRHKDKTVKVSLLGETLEFKGYSLEEVERLLEAVLEAKRKDVEAWVRLSQQGSSDATSDD